MNQAECSYFLLEQGFPHYKGTGGGVSVLPPPYRPRWACILGGCRLLSLGGLKKELKAYKRRFKTKEDLKRQVGVSSLARDTLNPSQCIFNIPRL